LSASDTSARGTAIKLQPHRSGHRHHVEFALMAGQQRRLRFELVILDQPIDQSAFTASEKFFQLVDPKAPLFSR